MNKSIDRPVFFPTTQFSPNIFSPVPSIVRRIIHLKLEINRARNASRDRERGWYLKIEKRRKIRKIPEEDGTENVTNRGGPYTHISRSK